MARTLTTDEILDLSVADRLRLMEALWDSIDPGGLPVPQSHLRALEESLDEYHRDPDEGRSWDEVRDELFPKK